MLLPAGSHYVPPSPRSQEAGLLVVLDSAQETLVILSAGRQAGGLASCLSASDGSFDLMLSMRSSSS